EAGDFDARIGARRRASQVVGRISAHQHDLEPLYLMREHRNEIVEKMARPLLVRGGAQVSVEGDAWRRRPGRDDIAPLRKVEAHADDFALRSFSERGTEERSIALGDRDHAVVAPQLAQLRLLLLGRSTPPEALV